MYPRVARQVQNLPGGVGDVGKVGSKAAAAAAATAPRGMRESDREGGSAAEVDALRARVKERQAKSDSQDPRSRLTRHLRTYGFVIKDVPGDNNCQFHAIADQLEQAGTRGWTALKLRQRTVAWLKENGDRPMDDMR